MSDDVVAVAGLRKRFGHVQALAGLNLSVRAGEVRGFLGPNGAGKSTTLRVLLGLARADAGQVTVFGRNPWDDAVALHRRMGYVPGDVALWPNLSGGEIIDLLSRLRGSGHGDGGYPARKARLLAAFDFDPRKQGRSYSKGNRQKVALIAAFATPAQLLILDEPTSGLDPLMEAVFNQEVRRAAATGATVLLSSHILSEVEALCDRVTIIRAGRTVETGTLAQLRQLTRSEVSFAAADLSMTELQAIPDTHDLVVAQGRATVTVDGARLVDVLPTLANLRVQGLTIRPPSLEELFLRQYGDALPGDAPPGDAPPDDGVPDDGAQRTP